ncbi:MAG: precorrin-6A reductase [Lachnospiraceae bacterium]|nr:precorrin-6A reductase [Lachnospiraceae bacterium]
MRNILIFAGTTEGRRLSECLAAAGMAHTVCVATEYGELVLKEHPLRNVHRGRMNREEMKDFIQKGNFEAVVDATHPYAEVVTRNIREAVEEINRLRENEFETKVSCLRLKREMGAEKADGGVRYFESNQACAMALKETEGNILLTVGSKELAAYCVSEEVKSRLYVRVLPGMESLSVCMEQRLKGKQVIAMQGPFSVKLNEALIEQYGISCLVTKQSGMAGGYQEKLEAAERAGIPVFVIGQPGQEEGDSFGEVCGKLEQLFGRKIPSDSRLQITLAGVGMGQKSSLTGEVQHAIEEADILLGAERMLAPYTPRLEKKPFYRAGQIIPYLQELWKTHPLLEQVRVVILFSGDTGFYSGCGALYQALREETEAGRLKASLRILPGISSVAYLASCIGESYEDAAVWSIHGKELCNLARRIREERKTFLLMSGVRDVNRLGRLLTEAGLTECEITAGYQLSYADQQIKRLTPEECCALKEEGLYTCLIHNPQAVGRMLTHGLADEAFIRDQVPMTKEEVREVSICKMKLYPGAVVYDIGSGTGSMAVEIAGLSHEIQVYAIEQKKEAVSLIAKNQKRFGLENITVKETKAPEGLTELPAATHALIGGSGGRLREILSVLYQINPEMRIAIHAVSLETISEIREILSLYPVKNVDIIQLQVNRARGAGRYHLMQAENPVWICTFDFFCA